MGINYEKRYIGLHCGFDSQNLSSTIDLTLIFFECANEEP